MTGAAPPAAPPPTAAGRLRGWLGSLKARMALILGLVLLLPAAYAVSRAVDVYGNQAERQVESLRHAAARVSALQAEFLAQARGGLERLAARPEVAAAVAAPGPFGDPAAAAAAPCSALLAAEVAGGGPFLELVLVGAGAGRAACASDPALLGRDLRERGWFREVLSGADLAVGEVERGAGPAADLKVVLAVPLRRGGGGGDAAAGAASGDIPAGVLSGALPLSHLAAAPTGADLPEGAAAYLVDRQARLAGPADPAAVTLPDWTGIVRLIAGPAGETLVVDGPSGRMRFAAAPVARDLAYALVGVPAPSWSWLERDLVLGVIAPVLMLAVAVIGIGIATDYLVNRHVEALAAAARGYASGRHAGWPELRGAPAELRELAALLARTTAELGAREDELRASLAQKEVLLREVHHRVKNNLQVVTSLLNLRAQAAPSPAAKRAMVEAQSRVKALALVHRDLYEGEEPGTVELRPLLAELCGLLADSAPPGGRRDGGVVVAGGGEREGVEIRTALEPARVGVDRAVPLALFVTEALSNAVRHAFPEGRRGTILVRLAAAADEGGRARLTIRDDGVGMAGDPAPGLGLTLMRLLAGQAGGRLRVGTVSPAEDGDSDGGGTLVELDFPLAPPRRRAGTAVQAGPAGSRPPPAAAPASRREPAAV